MLSRRFGGEEQGVPVYADAMLTELGTLNHQRKEFA